MPTHLPRGLPALRAALESLEGEDLRRTRLTIEGFPGAARRSLILCAGAQLVDFSSNDYLGLSRHPALSGAMGVCAALAGAGSPASHLVSGHGVEHARLEQELAEFTGRERALLFSSGYLANLGVLTALAARGERVLLDRLCHASLIDGARLSRARLQRYAHAEAQAAAQLAQAPGPPPALLATDGVFSMDGDLAPLPQLAQVARACNAWLVVDDAHGLGVLGSEGRGTLEHFALDANEVPVLIGTLGKALGSYGAFVAGAAELIDYLMQKARSYVYTTALPQPVAAATRAALALLRSEGWRREHLHALIARFRDRAQQAGVPLLSSATPIQPVPMRSAAAALAAQRELMRSGVLVVAIRPPTVPAGGSRLRVALSAAHTEEQVDELVRQLARVCEQVQRP